MILDGKVIVITGGTKGLGQAFAVAAAKEGASVVISGRDVLAGMSIAESINKEKIGKALFVKTDISKYNDCEKLFCTTKEYFGKVDGLFNYAGILPAADLTETPECMFDEVFDVNVKGSFFCCKFALCAMTESGNGGSIVFTGSVHAYGGERDRAAYACSKGALLTMMRHISKNYAKDNIRANFMSMGWVATPGEIALRESQGLNLEWLKKTASESIPLGRLLTYEDHIPGLVYLFSDGSSMVTGSELRIDGGFNP